MSRSKNNKQLNKDDKNFVEKENLKEIDFEREEQIKIISDEIYNQIENESGEKVQSLNENFDAPSDEVVSSDCTQDNEKKKMSKQTKNKLCAILCVIAIIACFLIGGFNGWSWLVIGEFVVCFVVSLVYSIFRIVKIFKELKEENKKQNNFDNNNVGNKSVVSDINDIFNHENESVLENSQSNGAENISELEKNAFRLIEDNRESYKKASKQDKSKFKMIISIIITSLVLIVVGAGIATASKVGFLIMGTGFVAFVSCILILLFISIYERQKYKRYLEIDKSQLDEFYDIKRGVVTRCIIHSQTGGVSRKLGAINALYQVWVLPIDDSLKEIEGDTQIRLISDIMFKKGDKIRFYQNKSNAKDCYLIK